MLANIGGFYFGAPVNWIRFGSAFIAVSLMSELLIVLSDTMRLTDCNGCGDIVICHAFAESELAFIVHDRAARWISLTEIGSRLSSSLNFL